MDEAAKVRLREIESELREALKDLTPASGERAIGTATFVFLGPVSIDKFVHCDADWENLPCVIDSGDG